MCENDCSIFAPNLFMNLVIDYGNTRGKAALFEGFSLLEKYFFNTPAELQGWVKGKRLAHILVSSVKMPAEELLGTITHSGQGLILTSTLPLPVLNRYQTPHTLGVDRLAAACGAIQIFPSTPVLVIDAGTCINYECVDEQGQYLGGAISPGLRMRFESVHKFTARLPWVAPLADAPLVGDNTEACIQSGIGNGLIEEINGMIDRYVAKYPAMRVILCGGDAPFFENYMKHPIFVAPDLVLMGLNGILQHNVKN